MSSFLRHIDASNNGTAKRIEKGLVAPDDRAVAFIDHQPQMLLRASNLDRQPIISNTVALVKATRIFDGPVLLNTVESRGISGYVTRA